MGAFWGSGGGWGWGPRWGDNDITINNNITSFGTRTSEAVIVAGPSTHGSTDRNIAAVPRIGSHDGQQVWRHGAGDSLTQRQTSARQQVNRQAAICRAAVWARAAPAAGLPAPRPGSRAERRGAHRVALTSAVVRLVPEPIVLASVMSRAAAVETRMRLEAARRVTTGPARAPTAIVVRPACNLAVDQAAAQEADAVMAAAAVDAEDREQYAEITGTRS
jgi:hypothetical protein